MFKWTIPSVFIVLVLSLASAGKKEFQKMEYVENPEKIEKLFELLHPRLNTTKTFGWKEVEGVSADTLKVICDSVVGELETNKGSIEYVREALEPDQRNTSQRITKNEMLALQSGLIVTTAVAKCVYQHDTFYLMRASSDAAFLLRRDGQIFRLHSGLYPIKFK